MGNVSFVSSVNSALHSIRERSLEDEDDEFRAKWRTAKWRPIVGDDTASEIEVQTATCGEHASHV